MTACEDDFVHLLPEELNATPVNCAASTNDCQEVSDLFLHISPKKTARKMLSKIVKRLHFAQPYPETVNGCAEVALLTECAQSPGQIVHYPQTQVGYIVAILDKSPL